MLDQITSGLIRAGVLEEGDRTRVISRYHHFVDYSYPIPIPTLKRDGALSVIPPALLGQNFIRGRFGAWRHEVGNMDHSVMMGVEAIDRAINGKVESVFHSS